VGYTGELWGAATWSGSADRLGTITAPTLVLTGDRDRLVPPGNSVQIGQLIPGATVRVLPDASHVFFSDQPAAAVAAVSEFLAGVRNPSTVDS
jgi:pimeloyl-ACP methyl ester carboxylesterase